MSRSSHHGDVYVAESGTGDDTGSPKSCFQSAEGNVCTGDTGAVTRIDRRGGSSASWTGWRRSPSRPVSRPATTRSARTASSSTATTSTSPTAARPARGATTTSETIVLRDPTLVSEDPVSRALRDAAEAQAARRLPRDRRPLAVREREQPGRRVGNPLVDSNPVDVYADHGRFFVADAGGNTVCGSGASAGSAPLSDLPEHHDAEPVPAAAARTPDRPDAGGADRRGQGPGRGALHEPADRLPVPGRRARACSASTRGGGGRPSTRRASRTSSISTSAGTARSTCSRWTTTRCSARGRTRGRAVHGAAGAATPRSRSSSRPGR